MAGLPAFAAIPTIPTLSLGTATVSGTTVTFPVTLTNATGTTISGIDASIIFNRVSDPFALQMNGLSVVSATAGPATLAAGKQLTQNSYQYGVLHLIVIGPNNQTPIGDGVIATITFDIVGAATASNESFGLVTTATDPNGWPVTISSNGTSAPAVRQLAVTLTGSGSVHSLPPGISCTTGVCSANFYDKSTVSLMPTPSTSSVFSGWTGDCPGAGTCSLVMSAAHSATATFVPNKRVRVDDTGYVTTSLGDAYLHAVDTSRLLSTDYHFDEDLILDRGIAVTLKGGYDYTFTDRTGSTYLKKLTIKTGSLVADRIVVQ